MKPIQHWLMQKSNTGTVILLSVALGASVAGRWDRPSPVGAADQATAQGEQHAALATLQDAFVSLADRVEPTVVSIEAIRTLPTPSADPDAGSPPSIDPFGGSPFNGSPFEPFFRQFGRPGPQRAPRAGGSGVIVRERGDEVYVLTNHHVVDSSSRLTIEMQDGRKYPAKLVGADSKSDLAVLRFSPGRHLGEQFVARMGNSDQVRVGQWAVAIGSPLGYDSTLTVGVISAKGRELDGVEGQKDYRGLIQTDASVNPGNSGGPLVNIDGQVVGINVAIASPTGASVGLGFAIPVNRAKTVMEQLISTGKVRRGYLGIATSSANRELSDELKSYYGVKGGALVENVTPDTPAASAGLKSEDVIVGVDGRAIANFGDLEEAVQATPPGKRVKVDVIRAHRPETIWLTLAERGDEASLLGKAKPGSEPEQAAPATPNAFGFAVAPGADGGVTVTRVESDSPAEDAGLARGDTILSAGGLPVRDMASWQKALAGAGKTSLVLKIRRAANGQTAILVLRQS
jgi:serine protease Do